MNLFFDTSALIKRYIAENGSPQVDTLLSKAKIVYVSSITLIECTSTIRRLLAEKAITLSEYKHLKHDLLSDFNYFTLIPLTGSLVRTATDVIDKYQVKTLDAIQLASAIMVKKDIQSLVACDKKLIQTSKRLKITVIDPAKK